MAGKSVLNVVDKKLNQVYCTLWPEGANVLAWNNVLPHCLPCKSPSYCTFKAFT